MAVYDNFSLTYAIHLFTSLNHSFLMRSCEIPMGIWGIYDVSIVVGSKNFTGYEWLTREEAYDYFINRYLLVFMGLKCVD